jgi:hypothetical protein
VGVGEIIQPREKPCIIGKYIGVVRAGGTQDKTIEKGHARNILVSSLSLGAFFDSAGT